MKMNFLKQIKSLGLTILSLCSFMANATIIDFDFDDLAGCVIGSNGTNNTCETISVASSGYFFNISAISGTL
ncbi:hypothetical protein OAP14_07235 [Aliiglaciecola sp.]|nr:hypothetical protein [Aliiglaciecola sp.]